MVPKKKNLDIFTTLKNTKIDVLQQYLSGVFSDLTGFATGALRITGPANNLDYIGSIHLSDASLRVKYTNVLYRIPFANVEMKDDRIDFEASSLRMNEETLAKINRGILYHDGFDNLSFDFDMSTNKLLVLSTNNTNSGDSYYGNVVAKAKMTFYRSAGRYGDEHPGRTNRQSLIYTLILKVANKATRHDFIVWKVYGREMQTVRESNTSNLTVNLDVTANNYANMCCNS